MSKKAILNGAKSFNVRNTFVINFEQLFDISNSHVMNVLYDKVKNGVKTNGKPKKKIEWNVFNGTFLVLAMSCKLSFPISRIDYVACNVLLQLIYFSMHSILPQSFSEQEK